MKRYVIATDEGKMPSMLVAQGKIGSSIDSCKRGWPNEKWRSYAVEVISPAFKINKPDLHFDPVHDEAIGIILLDEFKKRYSEYYDLIQLKEKKANAFLFS